MSVPIHPEPGTDPPTERCCFCRTPTRYWSSLPDRRSGEQVALCRHCASRASPKDVPTKEVWCRREHIAHHPTIGEIASGRDREFPPAPITEPPV